MIVPGEKIVHFDGRSSVTLGHVEWSTAIRIATNSADQGMNCNQVRIEEVGGISKQFFRNKAGLWEERLDG